MVYRRAFTHAQIDTAIAVAGTLLAIVLALLTIAYPGAFA